MRLQTNGVKKIFSEIDEVAVKQYQDYWGGLTVDNNADYFRRWLFAFCSVHTTWESNVVGYNALREFTNWLGDATALREVMVRSRCGLFNNRTRYISAFAEDFWGDPASFWRGANEPWREFRDRLCSRIMGLGPAKTSFALEMAFPLDAEVTCLDVHMLRLYGQKTPKEYNRIEADWLKRSKQKGLAPYPVRMVYWDKLQGKSDSRYWSKCLEQI